MSIFSNKPKVPLVSSPAAGEGAGNAPAAGPAPVEKTDQQWREELSP